MTSSPELPRILNRMLPGLQQDPGNVAEIFRSPGACD